MAYSSDRKLALSGWLHENTDNIFNSPLKLQKYLFIYEMYSSMDGDECEVDNLEGWKHGPAFSAVYGDYTYEKATFIDDAVKSYKKNKDTINEKRARLASFIVGILTENEIIELTHKLNIWKQKEDIINSGGKRVSLSMDDFSSNDKALLNTLKDMYPDDLINESCIVSKNTKNFLFSKTDATRLTQEQDDVLYQLSLKDELINPVFSYIDESGAIVVD